MNKRAKFKKIAGYLGLLGITGVTVSPLVACSLLNRNDPWNIIGNTTKINDGDIENALAEITENKNQLPSEAVLTIEYLQDTLKLKLIDQIEANTSQDYKQEDLDKITIKAIPDDNTGTLVIELQFEGHSRKIVVTGYRTKETKKIASFWAVFLDKDLIADKAITDVLANNFSTKKQLPSSVVNFQENGIENFIATTLKAKLPRFQNFSKVALDQFTSNNVAVETNDEKGEINITFHHDNDQRQITIGGFLKSKELYQEKLKNTFEYYQLEINDAIFQTGAILLQDKQQLPSDVVNPTTLKSLQNKMMDGFKNQLIDPITNLEPETRNLLVPSMVNLQASNETGEILISFRLASDFETPTVTIPGFTTKIKNNETVLWETLKDDSKGTHKAILKALKPVFTDPNILPSELIKTQTISGMQTQISQIIKSEVTTVKELNSDTRNLLTPDKILLEANDETGALNLAFQITDKLRSETLVLPGFMKSAQRDLNELWVAISDPTVLSDDAIIAAGQDFFNTKTTLPSAIVNGDNELQIKQTLIANLKKSDALKTLGEPVLAKLTPELLNIEIDDQLGTITISLVNGTQSRSVTITGFSTSTTNTLWEALGDPANFSDADFVEATYETFGKKVTMPSQIIPIPNAAALIVQRLRDNVPALQNLNSKILEQLTASDVTIDHNDDTGTITVNLRIGKQNRDFVITGYKTTSDPWPTGIYDIIDGTIAFFGGVDIDGMIDGVRNDLYGDKNRLPSKVVADLTNNGAGITEAVINSFYNNINDDGTSLLGDLPSIREFVKKNLLFVADDTIGRVSLYLDLTQTEISGEAADYVDKTVYYLTEDGFLQN